MIAGIGKFLNSLAANEAPASLDETELKIASAALLVHCAKADGQQSATEDQELRHIIEAGFNLAPGDVDAVIRAAQQQEKEAIDLHRFTRVVRNNLDREGRRRMVRQLWQIAAADGTIDHQERTLVALAARLLDVEVHDSVALRQAVAAEKQKPKSSS